MAIIRHEEQKFILISELINSVNTPASNDVVYVEENNRSYRWEVGNSLPSDNIFVIEQTSETANGRWISENGIYVEEFADFSALPVTGESGKMYITLADNKIYRWNGSVYVEISADVPQWNLTGNAGTNPATDFIGTTDAQPLVFRVNNIEAARLLLGGFFSVNTNNPLDRIHFNVGTFGSNRNDGIRLSSTGGEWVARFALLSNPTGIPRVGIFAPINNSGGTLEFMSFLSNGFVGINNIAPTERLHIVGNFRLTGTFKDSNNLAGTIGQVLSSTATGTSWVNAISSSSFIDKEIPTGAINGSNTTFTLANTPIIGSEHVYRNGVLQESGAGNDYTISGNTITYLIAPLTGDKLRVTYRR